MKIHYFIIIASFFSCSESIDDKCFIDKLDTENIVSLNEEYEPYTLKQILAEKPDYLEITNLKAYRNFKTDRTEFPLYEMNARKVGKIKKNSFTIFDEKFSDQFLYFAEQKIGNILYGLGANRLGYWLLKIENNKSFAYFLGLSPNQYYCNKAQQNPIVQGDYLQIQGSVVKPLESFTRGEFKDYAVLGEGKLFKIKLKDLMQDSDQDGYNDIFENSLGLNSHHADTDNDGINDFEDRNPMFKSSDNKFTRLYESLLPNVSKDSEKKSYEFQVYKTDCEYFHQINPTLKVLFIPEHKKKRTYYTRVSDIITEAISPIQKNNKNPNSFYIYKVGDFYKNDYSADFEDGKWVLKVVGGYVI
ncbi:hypothetical protein [Chryseobacterium jejuense]|uniref:Lipoprotein n=1 Tax=Chryseobacterium jejuense TaxID=445960 RepID=A0A2X2XMJ8_CHRJE|nr:hypothetical protein [Chryseobacterium jejuense]SDI85629.1 hypothetical protein SAMN05421542_2035 [Chryseobacterium jejuense]SQB27600.1 Uncharacterised protein [Chryseobacterium jejuense]